MDLKLKDKVVAITGGTAGIGEAVALAFAREGSKVAVCGRSMAKIDALKEKFAQEGFELYGESVDVSNNEQLKGFVENVEKTYGRLDVFINNAGAQCRKPFQQFTEEDFYRVVDTNLKSVFFGCAFASEVMKKTGGGVIINTSSFTATIPTSGISLYSATKGAVEQLTRVFASELAGDHIRVVSIQPGMTVTDLTRDNCEKNWDRLVSAISMKRLASPDDMIGGYLFLASEAAGYISGTSLQITGAKFATQNPHYAYRAEGALW